MGATFGRLKNWADEILTNEDLNDEIDNILENLTPSGIDDYSANISQMQITAAPVVSGTVSLATSLAGEIARLRYQLKQVIGADVDYWYEAPTATLSGLNSVVSGSTVPSSRLESIGSTAYTNRLDPDGTAATVTLQASGTESIVYYISDVRYELTANVSLTNLSTPPASQNTATFDGTAYSALHSSTYVGEHDTTMALASIGTNISSSTGHQAFKVVRSGTTEYFTAEYASNALRKARRGGFFDKDNAAWSRTTINTGDTVTLCTLAWIFVTSSQTLTTTYNTPTWSYDQPGSANTGDYWFDLSTTTWKTFDSLNWVSADAVLIGQAIVDGTACVAARSIEPYKLYSGLNECELEVNSGGTAIQLKNLSSQVNVYGFTYQMGRKTNDWGAADLEVAGTLATAQTYYAYVKEDGDVALSTYAPHDRRGDLSGYYHPSKSWRCLGYATTSSNLFTSSSLRDFSIIDGGSFTTQIKPYNLPTVTSTSSTSAGGSATGTAFSNLTNLSVSVTTNGRPVMIYLDAEGTTASYIGLSATAGNGGEMYGDLNFQRDGTTIRQFRYEWIESNGGSGVGVMRVGAPLFFIDSPVAGTYTYSMQGKIDTTGDTISIVGFKLRAVQL